MPPPSTCSKVSTRSTGDHEPEKECETKTSKSYTSTVVSEEDERIQANKCEGVGIVKSLLGPSFEDAVLRTLEFGKSLIQKPNPNDSKSRHRKEQAKRKKHVQKKLLNRPHEHTRSDDDNSSDFKNAMRSHCEGRSMRKRIVYSAKADKNWFNNPSEGKKLINVSKIRSLDSDLKQVSPSPEKIKRQLEALIQINRDEPPESVNEWTLLQKNLKLPLELTVMPNMCIYGQEGDVRCSSSCDVQSIRRPGMEDNQSSTPRHQVSARLSQAPEFISNALGPTLDVSIIENIKMMRSLLNYDKGGVDAVQKEYVPCEEPPEGCEDKKESESQNLLDELQNRIRGLEEKERCLVKQLGEAKGRKCKGKSMEVNRASFQSLNDCLNIKSKTSCKSAESKAETLQKMIACEEETLRRLRSQIDRCKKELCEVKNRKDTLKRNKSLLDAWDVIASRVCHTRLPSFSRASNLERKEMKESSSPANLHCCFSEQEQPVCEVSGKRSRSRSLASRCPSRGSSRCTSHSGSRPGSTHEDTVFRLKQACIPFPLQRDVTCGMHEILKRCNCRGDNRGEDGDYTSDDEQIKKTGFVTKDKIACRSKSDTVLKRDRGAKIVKVMWAVTRINIFQDNCRTYEVMDATTTPPPCVPVRTEGIFVVKNPDRKSSNRLPQKKMTCRGRKT